MNKYNQLREEIIKANKDILALKFGCRVVGIKANGVDCNEIKDAIITKKVSKKTVELFEHSEYSWKQVKNVPIKGLEIIGRDITLEDCLIAISKKQGEWGIRFWGNGVIRLDENITWKPNKPLQDQSDECKELLWDLICKK